MQTLKTRLQDTIYVTGLLALLVSLLTFSFPMFFSVSGNDFNFFVINFFITVIYFIILVASGRLKRGRDGLSPLFLLLILFLLSAYSLNREMNVFENSVTWLSVLLAMVCINYMAFSIFEDLPRLIKHLMCFALGVACCLFIYLSIYLVPLYLLSAIGFFLLGISLHSFVPLLFIVFSIRQYKRATVDDSYLKRSFYAGTGSVLIFLLLFIGVWSNITNEINKTFHYAVATNDNLPAWVSVAQTTTPGSFSEKLFKTSLVYSVPDNTNSNFLWGMPSRNFEEQKKHDPFIMTASLFSGRLALEENEKIKVLECQYDSRQQAEERLWSGENLQTDYINTNVRIWPQFSLAYTEKTITVFNLNKAESRFSRQEAIYIFHLPEGGVVSSLSLWINGKEEKGILTTKEKAVTAYKTIVGVENRDPSVVHWQEGNTVSVRVFPVMSGKSRVFKIGITAPLQKIAGKLVYDNIYFDGPSSIRAREDLTVNFDHKQKTFATTASLTSTDEQHYERSGKYKADWSVNFPCEDLSKAGFSFNGKQYSLMPYEAVRSSSIFDNVYLDLNKSWTKDEFEKVYDLVKQKNVYVYHNTLIRVNSINKSQLFDQCTSLQFSLLPMYEIKDAATSLIISKSTAISPNLGDLEGSAFISNTKEYLKNSPRVKLFDIGSSLSPYLKTLLEYRVFDFEQGNLELLQQLLDKNIFAINKEDSNHVVIYNASIVITESTGLATTEAPDHLMRLYAYNHIMRNAGKKLLVNIPDDDELVKEAKSASIVTPVSSLVVLETQEDYDRFKISANDNSLGNASLKSKGSVPEPHEWLLIFTAILVFAYIRFKSFTKSAKHLDAAN